MKRVLLILVILLITATLASCVPLVSADFTFDLNSEESWDVEILLVTTKDSEILLNTSLIELGRNAEDEGLEFTYEWLNNDRDGNRPVRINFNNMTPDEVNQSFSNSFTIETVNGQRQVSFYLVPNDYYDVQDYTYTLKGKKIISSNGQKKGAGAVTWVNPRQPMEAVLIEGRSGIGAGWILFLIGGGLVAAAVILFLRGQRPAPAPVYPVQGQYYPPQPTWQPEATRQPEAQQPAAQQQAYGGAQPVPPAAAYSGNPPAYPAPQPPAPVEAAPAQAFCTSCGFKLPPNAAFCPQCGSKPK